MKYALVAIGVACSACAQILAKLAARHETMSGKWMGLFGGAIACYGAAFLLYVFILRLFPISRISPAMTVAVAAIVVAFGISIGEKMFPYQWVGLGLCLAGLLLLVR